MINVLYFASLKEALDVAEEEIDLNGDIYNIQTLRDSLCQRDGPWQSALGSKQRLMFAINQEMVRPDSLISDGDEVAIFPPVTGG